jgi:hypothetical protein
MTRETYLADEFALVPVPVGVHSLLAQLVTALAHENKHNIVIVKGSSLVGREAYLADECAIGPVHVGPHTLLPV